MSQATNEASNGPGDQILAKRSFYSTPDPQLRSLIEPIVRWPVTDPSAQDGAVMTFKRKFHRRMCFAMGEDWWLYRSSVLRRATRRPYRPAVRGLARRFRRFATPAVVR